LVVLLYKFSPEGLANANGTKLNLLNKVLDTVVRVLVKNYDTKRTKFNQRPFYRLFGSLLIDLNALTAETDPSHLQVLMAFSNCFMILSPIRVPGFCFAWLELVSHSQFMPKLLLFKSQSVRTLDLILPAVRLPKRPCSHHAATGMASVPAASGGAVQVLGAVPDQRGAERAHSPALQGNPPRAAGVAP
jgi:hypothetical protein